MKSFPMINSNNEQDKMPNGYKRLDEIGFADLYVEPPEEQDFKYIKAATKRSIQRINIKWSLLSFSHVYTLFALNHTLKFIQKTIRYSH